MWEGRNFLSWYTGRNAGDELAEVSIGDVDSYLEMRAAGPEREEESDPMRSNATTSGAEPIQDRRDKRQGSRSGMARRP
jgi:hypothetical protein